MIGAHTASNDFMHTLAWSLLHFVWQGAAIAALAGALLLALRRPAARYLVGIGALALMLVSFGVTFALLGDGAATTPGLAAAAAPVPAMQPEAIAGSFSAAAPQAPTISDDAFLWLARAWLAGVFLLAARVAFGLLWLERLRRSSLVALPDALVARFRALQMRLGIRRVIRYCECHLVGVPAVIGFFRPVVLLPVRAITGLSAEQLEAVIAHELGHIKRFDVLVNFFQVLAETLFFFHPAVWWLNKRIRADREECCDDVAVAACGRQLEFARALATMAGWRAVPFAMAATGAPVAARVARLLGVDRSAPGARTAGVFTASLVLAAALVAGLASIGVATPAVAQAARAAVEPAAAAPVDAPDAHAEPAESAAPATSPEPAQSPEPALSAQPAASAAPRVRAEPAAAPAPAARSAKPARPAKSARPATPAREAPPAPPPPAAPPAPAAAEGRSERGTSYITEMKDAGFGDLDADDLIAFRSQGIDTEYVQQMRTAGFAPNAGELVAMKVHGVTPAYVREVRALGFEPDAGDIIALKAQGVDSAYVKALRDAGVKMNVGEIVALKVQDVTPAYVREVRALGFQPTTGEIIALKVQGVDAAYVNAMREVGIDLQARDILALKVQGVTPEYVKRMRAAGLDGNGHQFIAMKVHDVTPELARSFQSAGYKLNVDQLIHAKVMDVTPQFIEKARAHGFKNLDIEKLILLKNADVL